MKTAQREAGAVLNEMADRLAGEVTDRQYEQQPELVNRFGPLGRLRTRQDSLYHLRYLAESVTMDSPLLFIQYISWLRTLLIQYKVTDEDLLINLFLIRDALVQSVEEPHLKLLLSYLDMGIHQVNKKEHPLPFIRPGQPYSGEAAEYLEHLLSGRRREASTLAVGLYDQGVPIRDIYMHIFQASQYEIGRLWQTGEITVAQEHYCTACTQSIISQLYPYWIKAPMQEKGTLVASGVGEELHEIGLRMVADFFEMEGWNTYHLGANMPEAALIRFLADKRADVVAISATMTYNVNLVARLIERIRSAEETRNVKILVGGLPFNIDRELWFKIGADGYAPDAQGAIEAAERLTGRDYEIQPL